MYIQEDDLKLNDWQFAQRKYLPYETKLRLTETRIREWHYNWAGQVYLSYSGGLDSTVLLHMIRKELGDDVPAVFSNTGLEFPEIVRFARKAPGVFDPPHLKYAGKTGWMAKKYGRLDEHWPEMLHDGFQECMRVLKEDGVLIFKWAETDIPAQKV